MSPSEVPMSIRDNGIREDAGQETFREVKPVFDRHHGSVTPANSSQITDAAAAVLLMEEDKAKSLGLPILGYVKDYADFGYEPSCMGLAPVGAIAKVLARTHLTLKDFAVWEINEAFASVVLGISRILDSSSLMERKFGRYGLTERLGEIPPDDLNPHGGAIAARSSSGRLRSAPGYDLPVRTQTTKCRAGTDQRLRRRWTGRGHDLGEEIAMSNGHISISQASSSTLRPYCP